MTKLPFKIWFLPLLLLLLCLGMVAGWSAYQTWINPTAINTHGDNDNQSGGQPAVTPTPTIATTPTTQQVKLYHVAIGDTSQPTFGCGDSLQPVNRTITSTTPLTEALKQLLAIKDQYYGQSGLYNALYQSDVTVQSVTITNGKADIKLTGQFKLGGSCDAPRIEQQLTATAEQFSSVSSVVITIDGQPLAEALSSR